MCISASRLAPRNAIGQCDLVSQQRPCETKTGRAHIKVIHAYHDYSFEPQPDATSLEALARSASPSSSFPFKLYEMLQQADAEGFEHIVSWQPHGRCFVVKSPDEFKTLLPQYFKLSKLASFQRQLNLYGFIRLTRGEDRGGYYHELFLRGKPHLMHRMTRVKVKGTGVRARSDPEGEPDFWHMPWTGCEGAPILGLHNVISMESTTSVGQPSSMSVVSHEQLVDSSMPSMKAAPEDDDLVLTGWGGMKFHYLGSLEAVEQSMRPSGAVVDYDLFDDTELEHTLDDICEDMNREFDLAEILEQITS